jgi:preprotein translocase subunit YajC
MWGTRGNTSQDTIQMLILLIAFLCVPIMLIPKPLLQVMKNKKKHQEKINFVADKMDR